MSLNSVNTNMGAMIALAVARPDEYGAGRHSEADLHRLSRG